MTITTLSGTRTAALGIGRVEEVGLRGQEHSGISLILESSLSASLGRAAGAVAPARAGGTPARN